PRGTRTAAGLAVLAAGLFLIRMPQTVTGEFTILPIHNADVRAEVDETITKVFVDEGDTVKAGDPIVQLSGRAMEAELQKTRSGIDEIKAKLNLLKAGPRPEEVQLAKTRVAKSQEVLRFAQKEEERSRALFERGFIPRKEWEQAQQQLAVREKELEEVKSILNVVRAGSRKEELEAARAELEGFESQARYLETQKQLLTVRSPASGVVATPKLKEKIGQKVTKGDLIAKVYEFKTVTVEIPVSEKEIADVKIGQPVAVKARAYSQKSFKGKVISIAPVAREDSLTWQKRTIVVRANLDNAGSQLKAGMSGVAKIYGEKRSLFNLLVRRFLRFIRVEVWSWW
ncbi:MAG: HlyD family secretion protein, partial [Limisphaerales bacterium]